MIEGRRESGILLHSTSLPSSFNFLAGETFASHEEPSLESAIRKFLSKPIHPITRASLGVTGPVRHGRCEATNLPWVIGWRERVRQPNFPQFGLINDWEAGAYGIAELETEDFEILHEGTHDVQGNRAIISAGTGLSFLLLIGMALIGDGLDLHIPKGYIYFAMAFSVFVEMINLRIRRYSERPIKLRKPYTAG